MKSLPILLLFIGLTACQSHEEAAELHMAEVNLDQLEEAPSLPEAPLPAPPPAEPTRPQQPNGTTNGPVSPKPVARQIIRNANVSFQVEKIEVSSQKTATTVHQMGGFISASEERRTHGQLRHHLTIRIPANKLDTFLAVLLKESIYTESKTITAEDVTKRYVDLEARIRAKRVTEEKYLELLKKARNVDEVLKVEEQLAHLREDRETQEAALRELKNDVAMSTVEASIFQKTADSNAPDSPFYVKIGESLAEGFNLLSGVFLGLFYLLPVVSVFALIGWAVVRWWKKRKKSVNQ